MKRSKLHAKMRRIFYPGFGRNVGVYRMQGLQLLLRTQSRIDRRLIESGAMEPLQVAQLVELARRARQVCSLPMIFLDIGAYFGYYALKMRSVNLFERIVAFEPDAMNFAQLCAQLYLNDAAYEIEAERLALSESKRRAQMPRSIIRKNRGTSGLDVVADSAQMQPVQTITLDDAYNFKDRLIVAKVDVEGHQIPLLAGMKATIARNRVVLQMEIHDDERDTTFAALDTAGMKTIGHIAPDYFLTNIEELTEQKREGPGAGTRRDQGDLSLNA
jgi:FkbM family methyltransferase